MLQFAFCIAHCHRSVTSVEPVAIIHPLFWGEHFCSIILFSIPTVFKWDGDLKSTIFSNSFLSSYDLYETSSLILFCHAPTMNPLDPCRRNASGSKGDISAISLLSLINLSSYPHFGAALSARQPSQACQ